ncbi:phytanoyl-CoA dioxygenase family protein [Hyphococcus flavus]|uniref:Phytanoyl-CoA dioxygenase family protein n=1 Tax=Hyphococcus flavus TaxID=1866326 RepID=A0AAE9ZKW0_9PROT|nr:phytanoyl-CoA dioxygenase family protein [Hyphococcus flavus]WDI32490.1 phytanoyl-CoA dioxygenase family protein [Hyphococcus flavus]
MKMPGEDVKMVSGSASKDTEIYKLKSALKASEERIEALLTERDQAISALSATQNSFPFKLGAVLTYPLRLIRSRDARLLGSKVEPPAPRNKHAGVPTREYRSWVEAGCPNNAKQRRRSKPTMPDNSEDPFLQPPSSTLADPSSHEFYKQNGFAVFRGLYDPQYCKAAAAKFKKDLVTGDYLADPHTTLNVAEAYTPSREILFDQQVLEVMRKCIGDDIKFLQWSTYQLNHMSFPWHRDAAYRSFGKGHDWDESVNPYLVAKIIVYLECSDFALGVHAGSHGMDVDRKAIPADRKEHHEIKLHHRSAPADLKGTPCLAHASAGDAIVFDQRLIHCGRLLDDKDDSFTRLISSDKSFVSFIFGADNPHSYRYYSYFAKERDFGIAPMGDELVAQLKSAGLYLSIGQENYFDAHPEQREHLWLPERETD